MKNTIQFKSRYGDVYTLNRDEESNCFVFDSNQAYYSRVGFEDNGDIAFVDPEGGPFLSVGSDYRVLDGSTYHINSINRVGNNYIFDMTEM